VIDLPEAWKLAEGVQQDHGPGIKWCCYSDARCEEAELADLVLELANEVEHLSELAASARLPEPARVVVHRGPEGTDQAGDCADVPLRIVHRAGQNQATRS
jgi:hypothetical protein